jgi:aerobic-type carbon monoxide dehydrogenase small subunit (CoxS/CutS family)
MATAEPLSFFLNGVEISVSADPSTSLLAVLREDLGLTGAKYGCGEGACGVCTVLVDGQPARPCVLPAGEVAGRAVETIEGLSPGPDGPAGPAGETRDAGEAGLALHPLAAAFLAAGAFQCGYCTPGDDHGGAGLAPGGSPPGACRRRPGAQRPRVPVRGLPPDPRRGGRRRLAARSGDPCTAARA